MKLATVGKGGSGKTTIAGTLSRIFADNGVKIVAIDGDPNPNLALTLGMTPDQADGITYITPSIMKAGDKVDGVVQMVPAIPLEQIMAEYSSKAADNVDLIVMGQPRHGTAGQGCMCASHRAVRGLITELTAIGEHTITDMEAGLEHLRRGTARHVDAMLVVAEPYYRSLEAAARTCSLANELAIPFVRVVANKVRNEADAAAIESFCKQHDLEIIGTVPYDESMMEAERQAKAPIDFDPDSAGVQAIQAIAREVEQMEAALPQVRKRPAGDQAHPTN